MKKYIFIDVDGTLLHHGDIIPSSAKEAIRLARNNGHRIYLSTGRPKCELSEEILAIGFDGFVCAGGAYVEDQGQVLYENIIPISEVENIITWLQAHQVGFALQAKEHTYLDEMAIENVHSVFGISKDSEIDRIVALMDLFTPLTQFDQQDPVYKLCFYAWHQSAQEEITKYFKNYEIIFHNSDDLAVYGEITNQGILKSIGIHKVLAHHHASINDSVAYGDSPNDMEMIRYVGLGICMNNGVDALKAIADEVCPGVEEDGLYKSFALHQFI